MMMYSVTKIYQTSRLTNMLEKQHIWFILPFTITSQWTAFFLHITSILNCSNTEAYAQHIFFVIDNYNFMNKIIVSSCDLCFFIVTAIYSIQIKSINRLDIKLELTFNYPIIKHPLVAEHVWYTWGTTDDLKNFVLMYSFTGIFHSYQKKNLMKFMLISF